MYIICFKTELNMSISENGVQGYDCRKAAIVLGVIEMWDSCEEKCIHLDVLGYILATGTSQENSEETCL